MTRHTNAHHALVQPLSLGGDGPTVAIKDCINIAGHVTACGSRSQQSSAPATANAAIVDNLLHAGCRIIGKAHMHELAYGMTGVNDAFGTPINPIWPDRIPGGSSSGSAVAVANGSCDFAVGTDTGGSVRQPAICCGVFGFKPSFGRVSRDGLIPESSTLDCVGVFARDMDMLQVGMSVIDPTFRRKSITHPPKLARIKSDVTREVGDPLVIALMESYPDMAYENLSLIGAAFDAGMTIIAYEMAAEFGHLIQQNAPLGADVKSRLTAALQVTEQQYDDANRIRADFTAQVDDLLTEYEAIVTPALPTIPPTLQDANDPATVLPLTRFLRPFNLSGHPAIVLPARTNAGLPVGLQIVGRKGDDEHLCAIAEWFTRCTPYFRSPAAIKEFQQ